MELQTLELSSLHFPRAEWKWLRPSVRYPTNPDTAPDAFLWAARVGEQLWAWHPSGGDLTTGFKGMRTRVLILKTDGSELAAHGLYLKTTFSVQPALDVEWVAALDVLTNRLRFDPASGGLAPYWHEALEASKLEPHLGVLAQRGRFVFLNDAERQLVFDKRWDLSTLELLETLSTDIRAAFVTAARQWNLTASTAKEAISHTAMLNRKLGDKAAAKLLASQFKSAEEFRLSMLRMAQPELAQLSQKRIELLRGLHLPPRTSVYGDPSFEKDVLKITFTPRTTGDFEAFKEWVENPVLSDKIRELLEIYQ